MSNSSLTIPEGLDLLTTSDGAVIRKVWLTWKIAPLALFAIFWDGFIFFWYFAALSKPHPRLIEVFFPIGHVAVGVGITYYVLASLVNKTDIVISRSGVRVTTGPAPWVGNKEIRVEEIADVIVRERSWNRGSRTFVVMYADRSLKEKKLVTGLSEPDQADFVARTIREAIGLKDKNG